MSRERWYCCSDDITDSLERFSPRSASFPQQEVTADKDGYQTLSSLLNWRIKCQTQKSINQSVYRAIINNENLMCSRIFLCMAAIAREKMTFKCTTLQRDGRTDVPRCWKSRVMLLQRDSASSVQRYGCSPQHENSFYRGLRLSNKVLELLL